MNPVIQEMIALSAALQMCIREQNNVIFELQDQTLDFFGKAGQLIVTLASHWAVSDIHNATASLQSSLHEAQHALTQSMATFGELSQPSGAFYTPGPESTSLQGYTQTEALQLMYEATTKDMAKTMGQAVQTQAYLGDLRMQIMASAKDLLTAVLNALASLAIEKLVTTRNPPQETP